MALKNFPLSVSFVLLFSFLFKGGIDGLYNIIVWKVNLYFLKWNNYIIIAKHMVLVFINKQKCMMQETFMTVLEQAKRETNMLAIKVISLHRFMWHSGLNDYGLVQ